MKSSTYFHTKARYWKILKSALVYLYTFFLIYIKLGWSQSLRNPGKNSLEFEKEKAKAKEQSFIIDYNRTLLGIFQSKILLTPHLLFIWHDLWSIINQIHNCGTDWNNDLWPVKTGCNLKKPVKKILIIEKNRWKWTRNERKTFT